VLIAPSSSAADRLAADMVPDGMPTWWPDGFAAEPDTFTKAGTGVLVLANRYDGIDLPDDACRLVILAGLPVGMHLQERFLHDSVGALAVLDERIRARLTQGAGRATRNSADYAAVLMLDRELANFCADPAIQAACHPELRAELSFGLDNSRSTRAGEAMKNLRHFREQDQDWRAAEAEIIAMREEAPRTQTPGTAQLAAAAPYEVAAVSAAWQRDWPAAIDAAGKALDQLGGDHVRRYQALWHYILASWAVLAARTGDSARWQPVADRHFADARAAAAGTRWMAELATSAAALITARTPADTSALDPADAAAARQITASPLRTATSRKYGTATEAVTDGLAQVSARPYEAALASLGELAGATVLPRTGTDAEPDSAWMFGPHLWVAFEAKSEADPAGEVPADTARQAAGHLNYTAKATDDAIPDRSIAVIITPQATVHHAAASVAHDHVYLVAPSVITDIATRLASAWDSIRVRARDLGPAEAEALITEILRDWQALPSQWLPALTGRRLTEE
jgi:Helicase C-terminal domain